MLKCAICGAYGRIHNGADKSDGLARLVIDHDHKTEFIRGVLCEDCNGRLGWLENHPESYYLRTANIQWRLWVTNHAEQIASHLNRNFKFKYCQRKRFRKFIEQIQESLA